MRTLPLSAALSLRLIWLLTAAGLLMFAGRQLAPAYMGEELMPEAEAAPAEEEEAAPSIWRRIVEGVLPVNFDMQNSNLQAFLAMIRQAEGTAGRDGYSMLFGGSLFDSFADHPRTKITARLGGRFQHVLRDAFYLVGIRHEMGEGIGGIEQVVAEP